MDVMTPEEVLEKENPPIKWHYGTCSLCHARNILICHFGYNAPQHSYRICKNCIALNLRYIVYGEYILRGGVSCDLENHATDVFRKVWDNEQDEQWSKELAAHYGVNLRKKKRKKK